MVLSDLIPSEILTIIDAISIPVLAVITYYYAKETGLIRKRGQHPSFSLQPTLYDSDESNSISAMHSLQLTNNGLPPTIYVLTAPGEERILLTKYSLRRSFMSCL